jgi:hypothetical protein
MEGVAGNRAEERKALDGATGTAQNLIRSTSRSPR